MQEHQRTSHERVIEANQRQILTFVQLVNSELLEKNPAWNSISLLFQELLNKAQQSTPLNEVQERHYLTSCLQPFLRMEETRFNREMALKKYSAAEKAEKMTLHQKGVEDFFQQLISAYLALAQQTFWAYQISGMSRCQHGTLLQKLQVICDDFAARTSEIETTNIDEVIKLQVEIDTAENGYHALAQSLRTLSVTEVASLLNQAKESWQQMSGSLLKIFAKPQYSLVMKEVLDAVRASFDELAEPVEIKYQVEQWSWYFQVMFAHIKDKVDKRVEEYIFAQEQQEVLPKVIPAVIPAKSTFKSKLFGAWCCGDSAVEDSRLASITVKPAESLLPLSSEGLFTLPRHQEEPIAEAKKPRNRRIPKGIMSGSSGD